MKSLIRLFLLLGVVSTLLTFTGCKEEATEPTVTEQEILSTYLQQQSLDFPAYIGGAWVTPGSSLNVNKTDFSVPDYYVIDLRSAADFNTGHIKDAHNATLATLLEEAAKVPAGQKILLVCYSGQNATRGAGALRLLGYNATALKWGMASWHQDFAATWDNKKGDTASPNWLTAGDPPALTPGFALPEIKTGLTDGAAILRERVRAALQNTSWMVQRDVVMAAPENYFIINKWPLLAWTSFGHIKGAYRIDEDLKIANLSNIDSSKDILFYCYTGQTSAITSMWFEVMGYKAKSLAFGANGLVYSKLVASTLDPSHKKSAWRGEGSGSVNNFGYYDANGNLHAPN